jgi:hypothetical protein
MKMMSKEQAARLAASHGREAEQQTREAVRQGSKSEPRPTIVNALIRDLLQRGIPRW